MAARTQASRFAAVATPLGDDKLLLRSFRGTEALGQPFRYELEVFSESGPVDPQQVLGQNVTVRYETPHGTRYFNGCVGRFSLRETVGRIVRYRMVLVPWLWLLTRTANCRIFQNLNIPDIITSIFREHGFSDFTPNLTASYPPLEYVVQYRETEFDFVSRLMEQEGIHYYFKHENGKHTLVLTDVHSAHDPCPLRAEVAYHPADRELRAEHFTVWSIEHEVQPGSYVLSDYDFTKPRTKLLAKAQAQHTYAASDFEVYDYPGDFTVTAEGDRYTAVRINELQSQFEVAHAAGDVSTACPGYTFKLTGHPEQAFCQEYLITSASYELDMDAYHSEKAPPTPPMFRTTIGALAITQHFAPRRVTRKPLISGPQTAMVVGPAGQEIHTDLYGRVKVQFHWDRYAQADEKSSCWMRVAQVWAGTNWGAIYTPRIGQEVIVEFLEGDPDRPIITGRVFNNVARPPYELPLHATISTLKSNSSKGGGGFNEFRFEDKKGEEQLFIHAEKNQDVRVKNDQFTFIGHEQHLIVKSDQLAKVEGDRHLTVKGNEAIKVEGDYDLTVKSNAQVTVSGTGSEHVKADRMTQVDGDASLTIKGALNEKVEKKISTQTLKDLAQKVGENFALEAGQAVHIKGGTTVLIEAGTQLSLKVGGNFIDIGPAGVSIKGTMVNVNSGGAAGSAPACQVTDPTAPLEPDAPKDPKEAAKADPGQKDDPPPVPQPPTPTAYSAAALVMQMAAQSGAPFCEKCAAAGSAT